MDGTTHPRCQTRYCLDGLVSFFRYKGIIKTGIKKIKYRFVSDLAEELINLIPSSSLQIFPLTTNNSQPITLIPIPLHPSRLKFRGFNQAEVLGRLAAKRLNTPVRVDLFKRVVKTIPQVEVKDRKKRLENMEGVFQVNNSTMKQLSNETIILFDDVYTTGATLRSAANVLKRAGAEKVWGISLAHG